MKSGFLNKWMASIPIDLVTLEIVGVCIVEPDGDGKICRDEVCFERSQLLAEITKQKPIITV